MGEADGGKVIADEAKQLSAEDKLAVRKANDQIAAGGAPDVTATMGFLARYPASTSASDKTFEALRIHCRKSAESYLRELRNAGKSLTGDGLNKFLVATDGLDLDD